MPVLVAESGGQVVGWGALGSFRTTYTLAGTLEDSVYVHHDFLRQGIGSRLLAELIAAARRIGLRSILANISADQTPSIRLHEKFGFQKVARLRQVGQKFNQRFDAVYLQLLLATNKRPGVDAGGAACLQIGGQWPSATQAERYDTHRLPQRSLARPGGGSVIHCLTVNGKHKGKGLGAVLLGDCLRDARKSKCRGVAVVTSSDSFMAGSGLFIKAGFVSVESNPPYELLG